MDFRWLIARRYLLGRSKVSMISVISGISIAGMALGVASLIVVLSVMNGFYEVVRDMLVSIDPHVRMVSTTGRVIPESEAAELAAAAMDLQEVEYATQYVEGKALIVQEGGSAINRVMIVRGVESDMPTGDVVLGSFDVSQRGMVMGLGLGQRLGLIPNAEGANQVTLFSAQGLARMLTRVFALPRIHQFDVRGLYSLEDTYDNTHVFIGIAEAQELFQLSQAVSGVELRLENLTDAAAVKEQLQAQFGDHGHPGADMV